MNLIYESIHVRLLERSSTHTQIVLVPLGSTNYWWVGVRRAGGVLIWIPQRIGEEIKKGGEPKLATSQVSPQKLLERYAGKSEIK
jgi:hypothetical protein